MAENIFPLNTGKVAWETKKKQKWDVFSYESASGMRKTLVQQKYPKWVFDISFPALNRREVDMLLSFYARCKGPWLPFFYKDYEIFEVVGRELAKGIDSSYQAVIPCDVYEEPALLIDNVRMWVNGERSRDFTVDGGRIQTAVTGSIKFDYEYYFQVAFANSIAVSQLFHDIYKVSLSLEVVR